MILATFAHQAKSKYALAESKLINEMRFEIRLLFGSIAR